MKVFTRTVLAAAMMSVTSLAFADLTPADLNRNITFYDVNKDGTITRTEWMKMAAEKLEKMPAKGGMVDSRQAMLFLLELQKSDGGTSAPATMMSKEDVLKKAGAMFDKMDSKKAGMLDKKQFELFLQDLARSAG